MSDSLTADIPAMKISDVAKATGYSHSHIRRLAVLRKIPGCKTTDGAHYFVPDTMALRRWIGLQKNMKTTRHPNAQWRAHSPARRSGRNRERREAPLVWFVPRRWAGDGLRWLKDAHNWPRERRDAVGREFRPLFDVLSTFYQ